MLSAMKTLFLAVALLGLVACSSREEPEDEPETAYVPECTCGSPETAFDGCLHPLCVSGEGNPDNLDCVCGPLTLED